jgi:hypothetical protein
MFLAIMNYGKPDGTHMKQMRNTKRNLIAKRHYEDGTWET